MEHYKYEDKLFSPRIKTKFLTTNDIPRWADFLNDPDESMKFLPDFGIADPLRRSEFWIEKQLNRYREQRFGLQKIIEAETGNFVGQCGLLLQEVDGHREIEVGYHLFQEYRGEGYATEAAHLFIDYAFRNDRNNSIIPIIDVDNLSSRKVAERNGLKIFKRTLFSDFDVFIYRIHQHEWM